MTPTHHKFLGVSMIVLGLALTVYVIVRAVFYAPDTDITPPPDQNTATSSVVAGKVLPKPEPKSVSSSLLPTRLIIPKLEINAGVQHVGVKSNGQMANPSNFTDVAWYKGGTVPGEIGSAVMAGHVDNALALDGVFKELSALRPGDDVYVTRKDGKKLHFKVDRVEYYDYKNTPNREVFTSSDGKAHLNLVTCAGTWLKAEHSYTERLVVYTTLTE